MKITEKQANQFTLRLRDILLKGSVVSINTMMLTDPETSDFHLLKEIFHTCMQHALNDVKEQEQPNFPSPPNPFDG